jgi:hypothetical protein
MAQHGTVSFNLAVPGTFNPEIYYMVDRLLDDTSLDLEYLFLELRPVYLPRSVNLDTSRNYYWRNWTNTRFVIRYLAAAGSARASVMETPRDSLRYFFQNLAWGFMGKDLDFRWHGGYSTATRVTLGPDLNGYFPLEAEVAAIEAGEAPAGTRELALRTARLDEDMALIDQRVARIREMSGRSGFDRPPNPEHLQRLNRLLERSLERGIELYFVIAPRGGVQGYFDKQALKLVLPSDRVIDLSNPDEYPEFHQRRHSFDKAHLNTKGSMLFTEALAEQAVDLARN